MSLPLCPTHPSDEAEELRWGPFPLVSQLVLGSTTGERLGDVVRNHHQWNGGEAGGDLGGMGHARAAPSGASISSSGRKQWRQHIFYAGAVVWQEVCFHGESEVGQEGISRRLRRD